MEKEPLYIMDIDYKQARKIAKNLLVRMGLSWEVMLVEENTTTLTVGMQKIRKVMV